jgi:hypothetical protein
MTYLAQLARTKISNENEKIKEMLKTNHPCLQYSWVEAQKMTLNSTNPVEISCASGQAAKRLGA